MDQVTQQKIVQRKVNLPTMKIIVVMKNLRVAQQQIIVPLPLKIKKGKKSPFKCLTLI